MARLTRQIIIAPSVHSPRPPLPADRSHHFKCCLHGFASVLERDQRVLSRLGMRSATPRVEFKHLAHPCPQPVVVTRAKTAFRQLAYPSAIETPSDTSAAREIGVGCGPRESLMFTGKHVATPATDAGTN
jgi:hypothetical protein